ncbi:helicase-associated domain-containing protein [Paenibacillus alba]|uniref:helicase-associated domain-containing protein n=1 Tax=Paenibacillus alba TaxID=1197127 RepID=UPI0015635E90|nr:helicase-associated domain-containing protein [Paenibacillus alba]NQX65613.1 helicase-associated domain-containing protein [Paenibacillus alba]
MRYDQAVKKMPQALKELIAKQNWCAAYLDQGLELSEVMTDAKYLGILVSQLTGDEKQTLRLIVSAFGCEPFTREALEKQALLRMAGAQVAVGLIGLRRSGVIAAFRKAWGEQLFVLPEDTFAAWQELLFPAITLRTAEEISTILAEDPPAHPRGLAQQLFHFLSACSKQPALPVTNKGTLHKKQLQKLMQHVSLPQDILRAAGIAYAFRDSYDEQTALMLELAIQLECLMLQSGQYLFNQNACLAWFQGDYDQQQVVLYRIWRQLLIPAPVWLQHGLCLMEKMSVGKWCAVDDLVQCIAVYCTLGGEGNDTKSLYEAMLSAWLTPLQTFGFVELGKDQDGMRWFRWLITISSEITLASTHHASENGATASESLSSLYVQPDFELLLPPAASLRTEWAIASFADLRSTDLVRSYQLSKESVYRALEMGISLEEMIRVLEQHAYYEVPPHLKATLLQWGEQAGQLYFDEVTLLRCRSEEIADAQLRNAKSLPFLGERVGGTNFIVAKEHVAALTKCLEQMGYSPKYNRKDLSTTTTASAADPSIAQSQGLCYAKDTILLYDMDAQIPERNDVYPDIQEIPVSWLQEFRAYHGSTRKEMIRKAIEWKSALQLRKEGQNRFVIPRFLREERSGWMLEGLEENHEIALASDDWEEMKLILPGINDEGVYS